MSTRRRLPNGFGQISKIKGQNLRNPYRAMVTVGTDLNGRPICKPLKPKAYFPTYNDAYTALLMYHQDPDVIYKNIKVREVFSQWFAEYVTKDVSKSTINITKVAWKYCSSAYDLEISRVKPVHIKRCMEECSHSPQLQVRVKVIFNLLFDYAVECGYVDRNIAREYRPTVQHHSKTENPHITFSKEEMNVLWNHVNDPYVDLILIQCYSGWRPKELELLKISSVDLKNRTFTSGVKTDAGKNRTVPIHSRIFPLVEKRYKEAITCGSRYLLNTENSEPLSYYRYKTRFEKVINDLGLNENHRPHDPRKQFVTMLKEAGADEYAIKYLAGHAITDLTERVYTDRSIEWLRSELEKIP